MSNVILGGGISGLSAAYYLTKAGKKGIKIYESSERLGGWIRSSLMTNGTVFEHGPRTIRCGGIAGENTLQLVKELGLTSSIYPVPRKSEAAKNRMIFVNNQLICLPNSWTALFKIDPPFIKPFAYAILNDLKTPKKELADESIYDFVARRFGKEYADVPLSAMICGIFAGDAKEISVKALMSSLFEKEQQYGGVIRGLIHSLRERTNKVPKSKETKKWSVWSFKKGLETLPNHMSTYLKEKGVDIQLGKSCSKIQFADGKVLLTINGKLERADRLYSSIPSKNLATILGGEHSALKEELSSIPFVNVAVVNLEYDGDLLEKKGFGFLVPPNQNLKILGVIFDSCIFPNEGKTVLTVMMGGKWFNQHFKPDTNEKEFLGIAQEHVEKILKITKKPRTTLVNVMKDCIPQYLVGHSKRIEKIRKYIKDKNLPLILIGNSFDGVGVNDAIFSAKTAVQQVTRKTL